MRRVNTSGRASQFTSVEVFKVETRSITDKVGDTGIVISAQFEFDYDIAWKTIPFLDIKEARTDVQNELKYVLHFTVKF